MCIVAVCGVNGLQLVILKVQYIKKIQNKTKLSRSIKESIERAFKDKNTANQETKMYEIDDDSGKGQEKQVKMKRG